MMKKIILSLSLCLLAALGFSQTSHNGQKFGEDVKPGDVKPVAKNGNSHGRKKSR